MKISPSSCSQNRFEHSETSLLLSKHGKAAGLGERGPERLGEGGTQRGRSGRYSLTERSRAFSKPLCFACCQIASLFRSLYEIGKRQGKESHFILCGLVRHGKIEDLK